MADVLFDSFKFVNLTPGSANVDVWFGHYASSTTVSRHVNQLDAHGGGIVTTATGWANGSPPPNSGFIIVTATSQSPGTPTAFASCHYVCAAGRALSEVVAVLTNDGNAGHQLKVGIVDASV